MWGQVNPFYQQLLLKDDKKFLQTFRMRPSSYHKLLGMIENRITKCSTNLKQPIPARERLFATLRFMATGMGYCQLENECRIKASTLAYLIPDTCRAIIEVLGPIYVQVPDSENSWKSISSEFLNIWNYPMCLGACDGKHYSIRCPPKSGSEFYNYKGTVRH